MTESRCAASAGSAYAAGMKICMINGAATTSRTVTAPRNSAASVTMRLA